LPGVREGDLSFHSIPSRLQLTIEWTLGTFENRPNLIGQGEIPNLGQEMLEIWMSVPAGDIHRERVAEVQRQTMEIGVTVAPVHVSKIENRGQRVVSGEQMIAAEIGVQDERPEREIGWRGEISLKVLPGSTSFDGLQLRHNLPLDLSKALFCHETSVLARQ
jgi:hypothetical protein